MIEAANMPVSFRVTLIRLKLSLFLLIVPDSYEEDQEWRLNTILVMDGAACHNSLKIKIFLKFMKIPTLISSPYSPELCPIELIFN